MKTQRYSSKTTSMRTIQPNFDINKRLIEMYGEDQFGKWRLENPDFINYHVYEISHGFGIEEYAKIAALKLDIEVLESFDPVNFPVDEVELISSGMFNPLRYNVHRSYLIRKYYRLGNTQLVLVLFSGEELRRQYSLLNLQ